MPKKLDLGTPAPSTPPVSNPQFTSTAPGITTPTTVMTVDATVLPMVAPAPSLPVAVAPVSANVPALPLSMEEIGNFGLRAQQQTADVTNRIAQTSKTSDMDEVGKILTNTIMAAKGYDPNNLFKGGFLGFFKAKASEVQMKFDTVDKTVDRLVQQIEQRIVLFRQRIRDLEQMAIENKKYHDALTDEIATLRARVEWMDANVPDIDPNDPMSATKRQQWLSIAAYGLKRANDLHAAQVLAQQQQAQISMMADNSAALALKFQDVKVTTIPALKNTFSLYILNIEQKKGAEFANTVDAMTEDTIKKNAALLGQNTVAINTALTRSNISIEALQATHDAVIQSLNDVERIRNEMKARIATETPRLEQLSQDLSKRLAQQ